MTDNEIIKALECCIKAETWGDCEKMGCPASTKQGCHFYLRTDDDYENTIYIEIFKDALDLINRQKAEIEALKRSRTRMCGNCIYSKPTTFGKSSACYVECTNQEHIIQYCKSEISLKRQRTNRACKHYKEAAKHS